MNNFVWKWFKPEHCGILAFGGRGEKPEWGYNVARFVPNHEEKEGWFCYLMDDIPSIKETEEQLCEL